MAVDADRPLLPWQERAPTCRNVGWRLHPARRTPPPVGPGFCQRVGETRRVRRQQPLTGQQAPPERRDAPSALDMRRAEKGCRDHRWYGRHGARDRLPAGSAPSFGASGPLGGQPSPLHRGVRARRCWPPGRRRPGPRRHRAICDRCGALSREHVGGCYATGERRRRVTREQALAARSKGVRACAHCRPDTDLGCSASQASFPSWVSPLTNFPRRSPLSGRDLVDGARHRPRRVSS